uniref:Mitochondrial 3-ketoacyl-coa thiolase n=1 Tax=Meloidogyne javanica TaxID=6303 RepID=A0A915NEB3_MELJA
MTILHKSAGIFIVSAKRCAFGAFGKTLKNYTATDLAEIVSKAALKASSISAENIDHVIFGNVIQSSKDAAYLARHVGLRVEIPVHVPAVTVNRLCGSGFEAIVQAAQQIISGDSKVVLAGGTESMSQAPFAVRNIRFGSQLGVNYEFEDVLWQGLIDQQIKTPMGITAENLGEKYKITRQEADEYAAKSQQRWRLANNAGYFKSEIEPIKIKGKKGAETLFEVDEHPREVSAEQLAKLPPVFKKNGLVNAGNASGVCDGAAAVIVADEESVEKHHLTPLVRILGWQSVGCDPTIMGIGPVEAIPFAPQVLSVQRELGIDLDRLNVNGGAIALGHPLAASGARITAHLAYELKRRNVRYGIGSACIGGGQGIALLFENVQ